MILHAAVLGVIYYKGACRHDLTSTDIYMCRGYITILVFLPSTNLLQLYNMKKYNNIESKT